MQHQQNGVVPGGGGTHDDFSDDDTPVTQDYGGR